MFSTVWKRHSSVYLSFVQSERVSEIVSVSWDDNIGFSLVSYICFLVSTQEYFEMNICDSKLKIYVKCIYFIIKIKDKTGNLFTFFVRAECYMFLYSIKRLRRHLGGVEFIESYHSWPLLVNRIRWEEEKGGTRLGQWRYTVLYSLKIPLCTLNKLYVKDYRSIFPTFFKFHT